MLDCDSCQSIVWWIAVCTGECWTVTAARVLCDGFSTVCSSECWTVTVVRVLCGGLLYVRVNVGL